MSQVKRKHHKQPRYFLKGFSALSSNMYQKTPDIWVYKKGEPYEKGVNPSLESIADVAYEIDFYAYTKEDGDLEYEKYENILMRDFEQPNTPILEKIREFKEISTDEKVSFANYVGSMVTRAHWWKEVRENAVVESVKTITEELLSVAPNDEIKQKIVDSIEYRENLLRTGEELNIGMINNARRLASIFINMKWRFVEAPEGKFFFTSDEPVVYRNLDQKNSELLFPLSSKVTLSLSWLDYVPMELNWINISRNWWKIDNKAVEYTQHDIACTSHRELYACENAEWLVDLFNES